MALGKRLIQARVDNELFEEFKKLREYSGKTITRLFRDWMAAAILLERNRDEIHMNRLDKNEIIQ